MIQVDRDRLYVESGFTFKESFSSDNVEIDTNKEIIPALEIKIGAVTL